jgi:hypothetical protein
MSEHDQSNPYHLPLPSSQPIIASIGAALMLVGLVPDARLWRMALISTGAVIVSLALWLWVSDAVAEYRDLPDD